MSISVGRNIDLTNQRLEFDPAKGELLTEHFTGTLEACLTKAMELRQTRPDIAFAIESADGPLWQIVVRSPDFSDVNPNDTTTIWELLGNEIHKDVYQHPRSLQITDHDLKVIRNFINDPQANSSPAFTGGGTLTTYALALYSLLLKGTTAFVTSQYVLRRTRIVSNKYQVALAFNQVDHIWSSAQITSTESVAIPVMISMDQIPIPASQSGYQWGWLKKSPTVQQTGGNRFQITQEWWLEQWSTYLYDIAS